MHDRVVGAAPGDRAAHEPQRARQAQPGVPGQQARGGEPGQSGGAQQAAGDVVHGEPRGQGEQRRPEQHGPRRGPQQGGDDTGEHGSDAAEEGVLGPGLRERHAGQVQALPGDGQDQEGGQPRQQPGHVEAAEPQQ
ncbi:hypothetical protein [Streptomyces sp. HB2AG]|uniref:hypothetical protein n=1 Tax=Streptomyces sp. HB2AG TaxID=2983400 RepID=UPI0022AA0A72|nr:hypothetical protein [Streptomyces sp. HB2AG]MCZ2527584.1 hypothetical protein [Streptomyces sp. HB2AG]